MPNLFLFVMQIKQVQICLFLRFGLGYFSRRANCEEVIEVSQIPWLWRGKKALMLIKPLNLMKIGQRNAKTNCW